MRQVCGFLPVLLLAAPLAAQAPAPARTVKLADLSCTPLSVSHP